MIQVRNLGRISADAAGTARTIGLMQEQIASDLIDPAWRKVAMMIAPPGLATEQRIAAMIRYVRSMRYVMDPPSHEQVQAPSYTIRKRRGDCEDLSALFAYLALIAGLRVRFATIAMAAPGVYDHIYPEILLNDRWVPVEMIRAWPLGREAEHLEKRVWPAIKGGAV